MANINNDILNNDTNIQSDIDNLIHLYFKQPSILYEHLFSSYQQFIEEIIPYCLKGKINNFHENINDNIIYTHGFKCDNIRIKPATFENDNEIKYPWNARKNHLNYFGTVIIDVKQIVEIFNILTGEKKTIESYSENDIAVANIPIMVKSKYCNTTIKKNIKGECKYDPGGYFIVNGSEKIIMSIEKMVDNKILVFTKKDTTFESGFIYTAQINSRKNDWSDNLQIVTLKNKKDGVLVISTSQILDVPLFVLMRALGVETDKEIISRITYDLEDIKMINLLRPSISFCTDENGIPIKTKEEALNYLITKINKSRRFSQTNEELATIQKNMFIEKIIRQDLLHHLEEDIPKKIAVLGLMANKLLNVMLSRIDPDDRDGLNNKRIETPGILLGQLFRQNWRRMLSEIGKIFRHKNTNDIEPMNVIVQLKPTTIEQGIKTALATGVWGMNRSKNGVAQSLQRLSMIQSFSYATRILSPSLNDATSGVTSIRHINNNQYKFLCCVTGDTDILLSNRMDLKKIKDINDGEWVNTINPTNLNHEPSGIHNYFEIMPTKLFEIVTKSGRSIKATGDHPFLVNNNGICIWKNLDELSLNDKIVIRHTEKYILDTNKTEVIISDNMVLDQYKMELIEYNFLNKKISIDKLKIIARLIGAINTDGHMDEIKKENNYYYNCSFFLGEESDVYQLADDINKLGFGYPSINKRISEIKDKKTGRITTQRTWHVYKNGVFGYLIKILGGFCGEKIKYIPEWLKKSEKSIKREFLSAFQGGDGSRLSYQKNKDTWKPHLGITMQTTYDNLLDKTISYLQDIANMFLEFDIVSSIKTTKNDSDKTIVYLLFNNNSENLLNYANIIGYRYCEEKRRLSSPIIEHLKIREFNKIKNGKQPITRYISDDIYDIFIKDNLLDNGCVSVNIDSIKEIPIEPVYDFTTYSSNHSFVANSFVTHNCVETPEGQKIGIVKSLSMMATITTQDNFQEKVLKTVISENKHVKHPYDINPLEMNKFVKIFLNGDWHGVILIKYANELYNNLKDKRREGVIDKFVSIVLDYDNKEIKMYFDGGRLIRPLLMVNDNKLNLTPEIIKDIRSEVLKQDINKSWTRILSKYKNIIEYEDIESCNHILIADNSKKLNDTTINSNKIVNYTESTKINRYGDYRWVKYTHCEFHGWILFGTTASNIAFVNHDYATKCIVHFSQAKQSCGIYLTNYKDRMDISQVLYHPQLPLAQTKAMEYNHALDMPYGENVIVAIMCYTGYNQEDSLVFNKSALDRGLFRVDTLKKYHSKIVKNPSTSQDDTFTKPDANKVTGMKQGNYSKLNEKGFVPEETEITSNDIIIGKVSPIQSTGNNNKVYKDNSELFKSNVDGVIDRVHTGIYDSEGYEMYNVRVRMERKPVIGDKFCLTPGHEVLTEKGWISIEKITKNDLVYIYDPELNSMIYEQPQEIIYFDYDSNIDGKLYQLKSSLLDLTVTPNHRMWVKENENYEFILAKDCYNKNVTYNISLTNEIKEYTINKNDNYHNWIDYNGTVHCLTVRTGIFMVKKNNKPVWTGNSNRHG
jgi:DNA-directed RNA polymerase beta subunit/intein/homing endonuclease